MKSVSVICSYLIHKCSQHGRSVRSETILILNILFFFCLFLFSINTTRSTNVHTQFVETVRFFHPRGAQAEEGPGSCLISRYSLFVPLCCVSFFTFCLHSGRLCLVRDYKIAGSKQYKGNELKTKLTLKLKHFSLKLSVRRSFS